MNIELKDFQERAVAKLYRQTRSASGTVAEEHHAIILSAPTGSGKTVIATALMERIIEGDSENAGDPNAVFLWLTDQPELNEQTRKKFLAHSSVFRHAKLVTLDSAFDEPRLKSGIVYFLNTQRIGKDKRLVTRGDKRHHSIWEIINDTAVEAPASFWLIVDEAHRGMAEGPERERAQSIVQKFIKGSPSDGLHAIPLILGISATPQRFDRLLARTSRTRRPHDIDPEEVRESGLLKDLIVVSHPRRKQPSDLTLVRAAAEELERFREAWVEYTKSEDTRRVDPLLVIQIEDARSGTKRISNSPVAEAIKEIEGVLGDLTDDQIAHSLQENHAVQVGDRTIRYVAPSDIEDDTKLRVVLFKTSLNTGWDCPRAEVIMSFRRAVDYTHIAQLVGRMVRTPLARRVATNEVLNSVSLYLPYYDERSLSQVITYLSSPDAEIGLGTEVRKREDTVELELDERLSQVVAEANKLPTFSIERIAKMTNVKRFLRLGRELAYDGLDKKASEYSKRALLTELKTQRGRLKGTKPFISALESADTLDVRRVEFALGQERELLVEEAQLAVAARNIEDIHALSGRLLGEGLHAAYVKARVREDKRMGLANAKQELHTLLQDEKVIKALENKAQKRLRALFDKYDASISQLGDQRRQRYRRLHKLARKPESYTIELPSRILGEAHGREWKKHLYVDDRRLYRCRMNTWEEEVLGEALNEKSVVAWLRNPVRKEWSLCVPYHHHAEDKALYPDFLVFRRHAGRIVVDVLEPHSTTFADSWTKAVGLADLARRHGDRFGRIKLLAKVGGKFKALDVNDEDVRQRVLAVDSDQSLEQLFKRA